MSLSSWTHFIAQQGVDLDAAAPRIDDTSINWLMPLTDQVLISLEGPDSEKFLQGQLSSDVDKLNPQLSQIGANCTPKGMVMAVFRLFQLAAGSVLLRLPQAVAEPALANLNKYAVFSNTELSLADQNWVGLGLIGADAEALLSQLEIDAPTELNQQRLHSLGPDQPLIVVRVAGEQPRFEIWCPADQAQSLWLQLAPECSLASSQLWQAAEVKAGLVQLNPDSIDSFIPQMLNLQAVDGISFNKGCYTGQEVVARLQFRGKLKKLMYSATVNTDALNGQPVKPGDSLFTAAGRSVGKVLRSVVEADQTLLQAVISKSAADAGELHLQNVESEEGATVSLLPLPYPIDPELFERPER